MNSWNSWNFINHWSMNCSQFNDHISDVCPDSAVVTSWSLTRGGRFEPFCCNDKYFCHSVQWKHLRKNSNIEFSLNACLWIHCIQWTVMKAKSGMVIRGVLCLTIDIFPNEVGKGKCLLLHLDEYCIYSVWFMAIDTYPEVVKRTFFPLLFLECICQ